MDHITVVIVARLLLSSVFLGLGGERILVATGILSGNGNAATASALALGAVELGVGLLLLSGWQLRWVALLVALFLAVDAAVAHPFWRLPGAEQHGQLLHFLKNVSMVGGFLLLAWVDANERLGPSPQDGP